MGRRQRDPSGSPSRQAVLAYSHEVTQWSSIATLGLSRFDRGNRHAVYRVTSTIPNRGVADVVVRVSLDSSPEGRAQASREADVLGVVGGSAGPQLYDFQNESPWFDAPVMCLEHLSGDLADLQAQSPDALQSVGRRVAEVHHQSTSDLDPGLWGCASDLETYAHDRMQSILRMLAWARDPLPDEHQTFLREAGEWTANALDAARTTGFGTAEPLALLHGDIAPGNVMWTPDPKLIDWEYTRLGDPADEIAYTFDQNSLSDSQRRAFWTGYLQATGNQLAVEEIKSRTTWWLPVTLLGSALWWAERRVRSTELETHGGSDAAIAREPDYYLDHLATRIRRLRALLEQAS